MNITEAINHVRMWPAKKQLSLFLVTLFSLGLMVGIITWSRKVDYQVLYSNLSQEDASQVVMKLTEMRIPHRVEGRVIYVPARSVYETRLQLAGQGVPQGGGVGFEIFDKPQIGVSEFIQKLNYRRALQGELARTINRLVEVEQARVHIAIPEKSLFSEREDRPSASVVLQLKAGRVLNRKQIGGIVHLVSSSVEGLETGNVTVLDDKGTLLSRPDEGEGGIDGKQLEYQKFVNKYYEDKLQSMLDGIVGKGNSIVRVAALLDFTRAERTDETYDPDKVVVKSEERLQEKSSSGRKGGIPGVLSNEPGGQPARSASSGGESQNQKEKVAYEVSRSVSRIVKSQGEVKKVSVAVIVNGVNKEENGNTVYTPRTKEELAKYEEIVKVAIGFDPARGDQVVIKNAPFNVPVEELAPVKKSTISTILSYALSSLKYIIPILVGIFLIIFVIRPVVDSIKAPVSGGRDLVSISGGSGSGEALPLEKSLKEQVDQLVSRDPHHAAMILKEWLSE